ncbi:unknown [Megasphaera elsdenii CAG:570]|uniref:Uncharacterized protein n=1 Tax=Megasphaera elsdenii CAG:570 TaxID=1263087 RepID=R7N2E8_MEGEL|nr:unknown [Megasphaera elsdenii CAG:570]
MFYRRSRPKRRPACFLYHGESPLGRPLQKKGLSHMRQAFFYCIFRQTRYNKTIAIEMKQVRGKLVGTVHHAARDEFSCRQEHHYDGVVPYFLTRREESRAFQGSEYGPKFVCHCRWPGNGPGPGRPGRGCGIAAHGGHESRSLEAHRKCLLAGHHRRPPRRQYVGPGLPQRLFAQGLRCRQARPG